MARIRMADIIRHYEPGPGRHWFDKGAMRFFRTRLPRFALRCDDVAWFVTSEKPPSGERAYTLRRYDFATRTVSTVGELLAYATRAQAEAAARDLADAS